MTETWRETEKNERDAAKQQRKIRVEAEAKMSRQIAASEERTGKETRREREIPRDGFRKTDGGEE